MYLNSRRRRRSNPWRVILLLVLIAAGIWIYMLIERQQIESPFVPTPTPTRSASEFRMEAEELYVQGDLEGAIAAYERAVELDPEDVSLYVPLVRLLTLEGRNAEAIEWGQEAVDLAPEYAPGWAVLGMAYDWDRRVSEAIDASLRAVELDPTYAEGYAYLAEAYADAGSWDEAMEAVQTALELDPNSVDARRNHGYVLETMGNWSGAVEAYRRALEIHPNLAHIYMSLGWNYQALADPAKAIEAFRRAAELDPDRADALDRLGWTYYAIEEYGRAQSYLEQAIEADPEYAPAYGHLATTFWVRRNYESAIPNYQKAIELAYRSARRNARSFYVTVEPAEDEDPYPSPDVVMQGELEVSGEGQIRLAATLEPETSTGRWADAHGRLTLNTVSGGYTLVLEGMPALSEDQVYVGWFEGLDALNGLPLSTGPLTVETDGELEVQLTAEPVQGPSGPRIEHFYTLGLCYFYMDQCERAYPLFEAALEMSPEEENAVEGIRLCQEAEATPTETP
ncbi:MAG: tetratricopeptide repeat protein [Anaerolineae bacterium]|jgi:tetratricopeptide (TPR) repeat protein